MSQVVKQVGLIFGRSLFPFAAVAMILGTMVWGPWVSLALVVLFWKVITWKA